MNSNWTLKEKSTGELVVTVDGDMWKKAQKKAFNSLKSRININGFRKGNVPDALIRKQIGNKNILQAAADEIANQALQFGLDDQKLELVDRPSYDVKEVSAESATLTFACVVAPEVKLGDYKGLEVAKEAVEVTDEEVENEIKNIQSRKADWVIREEDEAAQNGDQVVIDFLGKIDGVPFEGGEGKEYPLELGSGSFIPGFEEQLVGVKSGETKVVNVTFPEDYQAADLAGKAADFECTVHDIKFKELPELDEEFIKGLNREGVETLDQLKENVKAEITTRKENAADEQFTNACLKAAADNATVEIPEVMITSEVQRMFQDFANRMQQSGFTVTQFLEATGQTKEDMLASMREEAEERVKNSLVLEAIVKAEGCEVSDEDINAEFDEMSKMYGMEVEEVKKYVSIDNMKYQLSTQKALDLIKESVK
ncbi:MAG: trigger factor [Firmicutes bacterium]|nr:trigger factor [Bacillota bacterium]